MASSGFEVLLLHASVNDASRASQDFDARLAASVSSLRSLSLSLRGHRLLVSTACQSRSAAINVRVAVVNRAFREGALGGFWTVISNDNIRIHDLSDDVHLNASGTARLFRNFSNALKASGHV